MHLGGALLLGAALSREIRLVLRLLPAALGLVDHEFRIGSDADAAGEFGVQGFADLGQGGEEFQAARQAMDRAADALHEIVLGGGKQRGEAGGVGLGVVQFAGRIEPDDLRDEGGCLIGGAAARLAAVERVEDGSGLGDGDGFWRMPMVFEVEPTADVAQPLAA